MRSDFSTEDGSQRANSLRCAMRHRELPTPSDESLRKATRRPPNALQLRRAHQSTRTPPRSQAVAWYDRRAKRHQATGIRLTDVLPFSCAVPHLPGIAPEGCHDRRPLPPLPSLDSAAAASEDPRPSETPP